MRKIQAVFLTIFLVLGISCGHCICWKHAVHLTLRHGTETTRHSTSPSAPFSFPSSLPVFLFPFPFPTPSSLPPPFLHISLLLSPSSSAFLISPLPHHPLFFSFLCYCCYYSPLFQSTDGKHPQRRQMLLKKIQVEISVYCHFFNNHAHVLYLCTPYAPK